MSDELVTKPIPKLIRKIAIPAFIGFFFNTMFNVVDTFYAGKLSVNALAALSISFPVFFIIIAMGSGIGTGATALIANALGQKNKKEASNYTGQAVSFGIILSLVLTIIGIITAPFLFRFLGAKGEYLSISLTYINIIYYGTIFFLLNNVLNASLQATGDTKKFRNFLIFGFLLNLVLDPWFMYGGFGIPAMGVGGIALATILIQFIGVFYMGYHAYKSGLFTVKSIKHLKPEKKPFIEISKQGFPASLNMMTVALGIFVITYFISRFGQNGVAAYGIATRVEQIVLMPAIGLNIAALTLVGQNNGAKKFERVRETMNKTLKYGFNMMFIGTIIVFFLAKQLMGIFTSDADVIRIGVEYLRIAAFVLFTYVVMFVSTATLQGLKKPMYAVYLGVARQIILPLIVFTTMTIFLGLKGIWWGVFIINWGAAIFTYFYTKNVVRKLG